jgi:hypothetical protein
VQRLSESHLFRDVPKTSLPEKRKFMETEIAPQQPRIAEASENARPDLNHERVSAVAHRLWGLRGSPQGSPQEDWFEAERQLSQESAAENPKAA